MTTVGPEHLVAETGSSSLAYAPMLGRLFTETIDTNSDIPSIVVSYAFWKTELFYLERVDPVVFAVALLVVVLAGTVAALWPALRMLRGNPVDALRHS